VQHHILLSYSRSDTAVMERVRDDLRAVGLRVWTDEAIEPGSRLWKPAVEAALKDSGCLVALLSPDAANSPWLRDQLFLAESLDKKVFLILARGNKNNAIPSGYSDQALTDIRRNDQHESQMGQLIQMIREYIDEETRTLLKPPNRMTGEYAVVPSQAAATPGQRSGLKIILLIIVIIVVLAVIGLALSGGASALPGA
jgi:hypothetical protein